MKPRVTGFGIDLNISPVLFYNSLNCVQAEACAFPHSLGCEERLKDVGLHFVGNSRTVIANLNYNATLVAVGSDAKLANVHPVSAGPRQRITTAFPSKEA